VFAALKLGSRPELEGFNFIYYYRYYYLFLLINSFINYTMYFMNIFSYDMYLISLLFCKNKKAKQ
jgi:hypothetical protein